MGEALRFLGCFGRPPAGMAGVATVGLLLALALATAGEAAKALPAFPGAEGWGGDTPGGRGGKVFIVTTLDPQGPGSLQEACAAKGPRIVTFAVSGVIRGTITIEHSNITIAGQTAPGAGITIEGMLVSKKGISDVVIRHIRVRPRPAKETYAGAAGEAVLRRVAGLLGWGEAEIERNRGTPAEGHDAVKLDGARRLVLDHVTASWAADEVVSLCYSQYVTVQWCTIEEGTIKEGTKYNGYHNFALFSAYNDRDFISIHHNLFANNSRRNPSVRDGVADICNNVIYNFRHGFSHDTSGGHAFNIVGCVFKRGPNSEKALPQAIWMGSRVKPINLTKGASYYLADNRDFRDGPADLVLGRGTMSDRPFPMPAVTTQPAMEAYELVLKRAGAFPRDAVTLRTIDEVRTGTGDWGRREPKGGLMVGLRPADPPPDADRDGMPDEWEKKHGLDPARDDSAKVMPGGYTAVEIYLQEAAQALIE